MFELYNAHLSAEPAPWSVFRTKIVIEGGWYIMEHTLPANSVFKVKPGRGFNWTQVRTSSSGTLSPSPAFVAALRQGISEFQFHLVDESELNSD